MISTCVRDAELADDEGTFTTSSAELSIAMTGTAGAVDGIDDSTVTAADEAGADGDVVNVLGGDVVVGEDAVDVRSNIASNTADNLRLSRIECWVRSPGPPAFRPQPKPRPGHKGQYQRTCRSCVSDAPRLFVRLS